MSTPPGPDWGVAEPQPLPGGTTWTASYEALDQRLDAMFFIVSRSDGPEFWAEVPVRGPHFIAAPGFRSWLTEQLASIAGTGKPNTSRQAGVARQKRLDREGRTVASLAPPPSDNPFD